MIPTQNRRSCKGRRYTRPAHYAHKRPGGCNHTFQKRIDALKGWDDIVVASESNEVLTGVVTDVIKGGLLVATKGMKIFVPASQATLSRNDSLDALLKKEVKFRIIDIDPKRRRAVGSIKSVLKEENDKIKEEFWKTVRSARSIPALLSLSHPMALL